MAGRARAARPLTAPRPLRAGGSDLGVGQALALGATQGPAELLPISSSGHVALLPALLGWSYAELDPDLRKAFEVALHVGGALGLVLALRRDLASELRLLTPQRAVRIAMTPVPAVIAGLLLRDAIERRFGSARSVAMAQILAGGALWAADRRPEARTERGLRHSDALAVGLAQAAALVPGVSRAGATLTAGRALGLDRRAAARLSREAALPVLAGAAGLEAVRLRRRGIPRALRPAFAAGAGAAFASAIMAAPLAHSLGAARSYAGFGAYRILLGSLALERLRRMRAARAVASDSMRR